MKILVLCHGNINRSPLCAAVLQTLGHHTKSAGFVNPGRRAAAKMREAAEAQGYDLIPHRSQLCNSALTDWADMVVLMDGGNWKRYEAWGFDMSKASLLGHYGSPKINRIPDPAFMSKDSPEFAETVTLIIERSKALHKDLSC